MAFHLKQTSRFLLLAQYRNSSRNVYTQVIPGLKIWGKIKPEHASVLTADGLDFLGDLHRKFEPKRQELLTARVERQKEFDQGGKLEFSQGAHTFAWKVAPIPEELKCRHCEITGPVDKKMIINAMNSGADVFMADFEDSCSPTFANLLDGQVNLKAAHEGTIEFANPDGTVRKLNKDVANLFVRTRGWHLDEKHILVDGNYVSGAIFDFATYFFHNIKQRLASNSSTYFYLPKMEHHLECRLWKEIFEYAEDYTETARGKIKATIMLETLPAAYEMEGMLYELRDYACGMNAGRWDYIFSAIKVLKTRADKIMPDRKQVTMTVPFMHAYSQNLVKICHTHGAHAMGGMSAFIPSRRDKEANRIAMDQVTKDKKREVKEGYDGTWVAHPDLVCIAKDTFTIGLMGGPNQLENLRPDVQVTEADLIKIRVEGGKITEEGVRTNISVALQYLSWWIRGLGAVAINNLMEDAATAEISRAQIWQWLHSQSNLDDGRTFTKELLETMVEEEIAKIGGRGDEYLEKAADIFKGLVVSDDFPPFLTIPAYESLVGPVGK